MCDVECVYLLKVTHSEQLLSHRGTLEQTDKLNLLNLYIKLIVIILSIISRCCLRCNLGTGLLSVSSVYLFCIFMSQRILINDSCMSL